MKTGQYLHRTLKGYSASATNHVVFFSLAIKREKDYSKNNALRVSSQFKKKKGGGGNSKRNHREAGI